MGKLSLPRLARGTIVDGATLAEVGEDGAEAIIPLENHTEWIGKVAKGLKNELKGDMPGSYKSEADYKTMFRAFKDALKDMKVVLDDEVAGGFVERTVTRIIYT